MKTIFQYMYYRIAKTYKDIFGIEDSPGFLIQSCYSWGLIVLLASICFYLLAVEVTTLYYLDVKMKALYAIMTIVPFIIVHVFSEEIFGDERERYKSFEKKYKNERLAWLKGIGILFFVLLSFPSYLVALFLCK